MKIEYVIDGHRYPGNAVEVAGYENHHSTISDVGKARIAEACAHHHWSKHRGFEHGWPIVFCIYIDGNPVGKFVLDMYVEPAFMASPVEDWTL